MSDATHRVATSAGKVRVPVVSEKLLNLCLLVYKCVFIRRLCLCGCEINVCVFNSVQQTRIANEQL